MRKLLLAIASGLLAGCGAVGKKPTEAAAEKPKAFAPGAAPAPPVTPSGLPWTLEEANRKLAGKTKAEVMELLGQPDDSGGLVYKYNRQIYLVPNGGARDEVPTGMRVDFIDSGKVLGVHTW